MDMSNSTATEQFILNYAAPGIGTLFSTLLTLGPMGAVLAVRKTEDLGDVNPDPFPLLFTNCIAWSMYGAACGNPFVFAGNILGITLSLFYMLTTYGYAETKTRRRIEMVVLPLIFIETLVGFSFVVVGHTIGLTVLGYLANGIVFVVFSSPLSTAAKVVSTKNSASINRPFGIIQVLNCITWTVYAAYVGDMYLLVPNAFGLLLGVIQVILMIIYPATKPNKDTGLLTDQD